MCEIDPKTALRFNDERIVNYIDELKRLRDEVLHIIRKQEEERIELNLELERLNYKINLVSKSLAQRMISRDRYNEAIAEAEEYYNKLVESSGALLEAVSKDFNELFESMDKKVGTADNLDACLEGCPFKKKSRSGPQ